VGALKNVELNSSRDLESSQYLAPKKCFSSNSNASSRSSSVSNFSSVSTHQDTKMRGPVVSTKAVEELGSGKAGQGKEETETKKEEKKSPAGRRNPQGKSPVKEINKKGTGKVKAEENKGTVEKEETSVKVDDIKPKVNGHQNKRRQDRSPSKSRNTSVSSKASIRSSSPKKAMKPMEASGKPSKAAKCPVARVPGPVAKAWDADGRKTKTPTLPQPQLRTDQEKFEELFQVFLSIGFALNNLPPSCTPAGGAM
jgi:hypothetical protein